MRWPTGTLLGHWHLAGTGCRDQQPENIGLTCTDIGGRGRYRTADRWCVKPELYH